MLDLRIQFIVIFLVLISFVSINQISSAYADTFISNERPPPHSKDVDVNGSLKIFFCANNPISKVYNLDTVGPGQIMDSCKERLDGYSWTSRIYVLIWAPGWNANEFKLDTLGNTNENPISVNSRDGRFTLIERSDCNPFIETGEDHGLFYGSIKLSGFRTDVNGDGKADVYGGNKCEYKFSTIDDGNGKVETKQEGAVTLNWRYHEDYVMSKTATYSMNEAKMKFDNEEYVVGDEGILTLTDVDLLRWPFDTKIGYPIRIYSTTDLGGIEVNAYYAKNYAGIPQRNGEYPIKVVFVDGKSSIKETRGSGAPFGTLKEPNSIVYLRVNPGDNIYAEFYDKTLPKPASIGDEKKIEAFARISKINNDTTSEKSEIRSTSTNEIIERQKNIELEIEPEKIKNLSQQISSEEHIILTNYHVTPDIVIPSSFSTQYPVEPEPLELEPPEPQKIDLLEFFKRIFSW
ncbi:hypothetical protein OAP96_00255 [Candidatus Nitrosopelagicus sp.]|jgi:hypothetical protein|nr:hypothetical protein [Candidatus Nitrosopelagicus sp.]